MPSSVYASAVPLTKKITISLLLRFIGDSDKIRSTKLFKFQKTSRSVLGLLSYDNRVL